MRATATSIILNTVPTTIIQRAELGICNGRDFVEGIGLLLAVSHEFRHQLPGDKLTTHETPHQIEEHSSHQHHGYQ